MIDRIIFSLKALKHGRFHHRLRFFRRESGAIEAEFEPQAVDEGGQADRCDAALRARKSWRGIAEQSLQLRAGAAIESLVRGTGL